MILKIIIIVKRRPYMFSFFPLSDCGSLFPLFILLFTFLHSFVVLACSSPGVGSSSSLWWVTGSNPCCCVWLRKYGQFEWFEGVASNQVILGEPDRWKNHWFAWRANQWPLIGETLFSVVPPNNSHVSVSGTSEGFLSWNTLHGPLTHLVRFFRNYRDTRTPSGVAC